MESIRRYEMMVLADPNVDENKINILFDKLADLGGKLGAKLVNRSLWGKRRLAYEIKDLKEGVYYILDIESVPSAVNKLESYLKIQNEVLRFLTVVKGERTEEQSITEQSSEASA
ncbi:MAG: 30S ribosomal protein S6 [bacterium]|nr:30S ribosomal protein S6 [bacterium]